VDSELLGVPAGSLTGKMMICPPYQKNWVVDGKTRQRNILSMAKCDVDVIIGDWMSECTMGWHGVAKSAAKANGTVSDKDRVGLYDPSFMDTFSPALGLIEQKGIKVAVNAGASDTEMLAKLVEKTIKEGGHKLNVAWVEGGMFASFVPWPKGLEWFDSTDRG
jgi:4-hydroxy-3-methylbut-2-enyl diphosphate reductase IspH